MMIRLAVVAALTVAVVGGTIALAALRIVTAEDWPEW